MNVLGTMKTRLATLTIAAVATLAVSSSFSEGTKELCEGFLPQNEMKIPVGFKSTAAGAAGLTEAQFNAVLDRTSRLYAPVIAQRGGTLKINRLWTDSTVNASAQQNGSSWVLNMYGGLARHQATTEEGFALVVCHELGHHLGGAPKIQSWFGGNWATNEGGADYYANLKCLRNFFAEDDNQTLVDAAKADGRLSAFAANLCDQEFSKGVDRLLCKRATLGGISVANLFHDLSKNAATPDFATPDTSVVKKMNDAHPATQCRLDTYLAGSICNVDATVANSDTDYRQGSCVEGVAKVGFRPRCWFKP
jgi:hypothetical protein